MSASAPDTAIMDDAPPPQPETDAAFLEGSAADKNKSKSTTTARRATREASGSTASSVATSDNDTGDDDVVGMAWKARNSFTADSPYFNAFCETEVKQLHVLSDSLREIANRTQTLTKTGMVMSQAAQRLSASCKFQSLSSSSSSPFEDNPNETPLEKEERLAAIRQARQVKRQAVGEEMASFLEVLGDVSPNCESWKLSVLRPCRAWFVCVRCGVFCFVVHLWLIVYATHTRIPRTYTYIHTDVG